MTKLWTIAAVGASCVLLGACATSETVVLANQSGMTVQCGPYQALRTIYAPADYLVSSQFRDCVASYESQGYQRIDRPSQAKN